MKKTYSEQLKDPRWQKKRLQIMERDGFSCFICGDTESTLNVHHKRYIYGKLAWEYDDSNYMTLCEECHEKLTDSIKVANQVINEYTIDVDIIPELLISCSTLYPNYIRVLVNVSDYMNRLLNDEVSLINTGQLFGELYDFDKYQEKIRKQLIEYFPKSLENNV